MTSRTAPSTAELIALVYELLDAHHDTAALIRGRDGDGALAWAAHLDYLRALQRMGREILARTASAS